MLQAIVQRRAAAAFVAFGIAALVNPALAHAGQPRRVRRWRRWGRCRGRRCRRRSRARRWSGQCRAKGHADVGAAAGRVALARCGQGLAGELEELGKFVGGVQGMSHRVEPEESWRQPRKLEWTAPARHMAWGTAWHFLRWYEPDQVHGFRNPSQRNHAHPGQGAKCMANRSAGPYSAGGSTHPKQPTKGQRLDSITPQTMRSSTLAYPWMMQVAKRHNPRKSGRGCCDRGPGGKVGSALRQ